MTKSTRTLKKYIAFFLVMLISIDSFAAIVSDNDGSAFVTKSEFEIMKKDFAKQVDNYNSSLDGKIDGAIGAYLAGFQLANKKDLEIEALNIFNFPLQVGQPDAKWSPSNRHSFQLKNFYVMRPYSSQSGSTINKDDSGLASWKIIKEEKNRIPIYFIDSTNISTPSVVGIYNQKVELESMVANGNWAADAAHGATMLYSCSVDATATMRAYGSTETNISGDYWRRWPSSYNDQVVYLDNTPFYVDMCMSGLYKYGQLVTEDVGHTESAKSSKLTSSFSWQGQSIVQNYIDANKYLDKKFDYVGDKFDAFVFCIDNEKPSCRIGWYCVGSTNTTNTKDYETELSSVVVAGQVNALLKNPSIPDVWPLCKTDYNNYADFKNDTDSAFARTKLIYYEVYTDNAKFKKSVPLTSGLPLGISSSNGTISVDLEIDMKGPYNESTGKYEKTQGIEIQFSKKPFNDYNPDEKDLLKSKYKNTEAKKHSIVPNSNLTDSYYFTIDDIDKNDEIWMLINRKNSSDQIIINKVNSFAITTMD